MPLRGLSRLVLLTVAISLPSACSTVEPRPASEDVVYTALVFWPEADPQIDEGEQQRLGGEQLRWLDALARARFLVAAGPMDCESAEAASRLPGGVPPGLLVLDVEDESTIDEVLAHNEAVQAGLFRVERVRVRGSAELRRVPYLDSARRAQLAEQRRGDRAATISTYVVGVAADPDAEPADSLDPALVPWTGRTIDGRRVAIVWTRSFREARSLLGDAFTLVRWQSSRGLADLSRASGGAAGATAEPGP